jgi:DMSO/TMAO reductase YedYZ molybdopterin-dependent catalytic subunit
MPPDEGPSGDADDRAEGGTSEQGDDASPGGPSVPPEQPHEPVPGDAARSDDAGAGGGADQTGEPNAVSGPAPDYGFPVAVWRMMERHRPPGLGRSRLWRSPLRGPWLTSVFGAVLLVGLPIVIVTGLLSYIAYGPQFGQAIPADVGGLHLPYFDWPTRPSWLYRLTEGLHVGIGLVLVPVVLAKLWSVVPKLFSWPPARSLAQVVERLSLLLLVGGILFEIVTGVLNIQYDYVFEFSFYTGHYFAAWVFLSAFVVHVAVKLPRLVTSLRSRSFRAEMRTPRTETRPEPPDPDGLVAADPAEPTLSRRGALMVAGGGSVMVAGLTAGQIIGGITRGTAVLLPRGRSYGQGPTDFQVNRTAVAAGIAPAWVGAGLAANTRRRPTACRDQPSTAAGDATAHGDAAHCVRGGLVHRPDVERGAPW